MGLGRSIRAGSYVLRRGLQGMRESPLVQLFAISTTGVCMLLLGGIMLAWVNVHACIDAWGIDVPITIYLEDEVDPADVNGLVGKLEAIPGVTRVDDIEPEAAMQRLVAGFGRDEAWLEGVEPEMFPRTLEVFFAVPVDADVGEALEERLRGFELVEDVARAGAWAAEADTLLRTLARLAGGAALLVGAASMAIIWTTIRLAVYARRSEIQILRLVGGTSDFVRGPFLVEGALQGMLGAGLALLLLTVTFDALRPILEPGLKFVVAAGSLRFFTAVELAGGLVFGAALGILGARAATGRYVEQ